MNNTPTDSQMLDWLECQSGFNAERHYQAYVDERTEFEQMTGGYSGRVNFFSLPSQHLNNMPSLRAAIAKAMEMDQSLNRHPKSP